MAIGQPRPVPGEKVVSIASGFGAALGCGFAWKQNPTMGFFCTLGVGISSLAGAVFTSGVLAEVLEGAAAGCLGAFGLLLPFMIGEEPAYGGRMQQIGSTMLPAAIASAPSFAGRGVAWQPKTLQT